MEVQAILSVPQVSFHLFHHLAFRHGSMQAGSNKELYMCQVQSKREAFHS